MAFASLKLSTSLQQDAEKLIISGDDNDIKLICKFLMPPTRALHILAQRNCGDPPLDNPHEKALLASSLWGPLPSGEGLDWSLVLEGLKSTDITSAAQVLDKTIHSTFCKIPFACIVLWLIGIQNSFISEFVESLFNFSNTLAQSFEEKELVLLQKELKNPLSIWIVSAAISEILSLSPGPAHPLGFLTVLIKQQFQSSTVLGIAQRLSILEVHFTSKKKDPDGHSLLGDILRPTSFVLWEKIQKNNPQGLARLYTDTVTEMFYPLLFEEVKNHGLLMKNLFEEWLNFSEDVYACFNTDGRLSDYFMEFAQDLLVEQKNVFLATAVGLGLWFGGFNSSPRWEKVWAMIIPQGNFVGCKPFMEEHDCLPYFQTEMTSSAFATTLRYLAKQQKIEQNICQRSGVEIELNTALGNLGVQAAFDDGEGSTPPSSMTVTGFDDGSKLETNSQEHRLEEQANDNLHPESIQQKSGNNDTLGTPDGRRKRCRPFCRG